MAYPRRTFGNLKGALTVITLGIALAACTDRPGTESLESDTTGMTMDSDAERDTTAFGDEALGARADTVEVRLREFTIDMPSNLESGPTVFRVNNVGDMVHNFEVEGQGIEEMFETDLESGETNTLRVDLPEGTYTVYCPVDDHRSEGMEMELIVSGDAGPISVY